jgi:hypothetical protein
MSYLYDSLPHYDYDSYPEHEAHKDYLEALGYYDEQEDGEL